MPTVSQINNNMMIDMCDLSQGSCCDCTHEGRPDQPALWLHPVHLLSLGRLQLGGGQQPVQQLVPQLVYQVVHPAARPGCLAASGLRGLLSCCWPEVHWTVGWHRGCSWLQHLGLAGCRSRWKDKAGDTAGWMRCRGQPGRTIDTVCAEVLKSVLTKRPKEAYA